jgi:hypothetical protein
MSPPPASRAVQGPLLFHVPFLKWSRLFLVFFVDLFLKSHVLLQLARTFLLPVKLFQTLVEACS